jgi:hypothetical protein
MRTVFALLALTVIVGGSYRSAFAQQYLTGELSGNYPAGEYSISGNVHVLPKKTLSFAAGSVLRFENFTGIVVRGELVCKGTAAQPVIFTSYRDVPGTKTPPEAFDWNGIKVTAEASAVSLENCTIAYSTFGLDIELNKTPASIKNVTFRLNGTASLTREKRMMQMQENTPLSFAWPEAAVKPNTPTNTEKPREPLEPLQRYVSQEKTKNEKAGPQRPAWIKTVRITGASIVTAGAALWLIGHLQAEHYNNLVIKPGTSAAMGNSYKNSRDGWVTARNVGIGLFGIGAAGFVITFGF